MGQPLSLSVPALFLGDSKYDYQAASAAGLDFVFLSGWSEVADWEAWVSANGLAHVNSVQSLVDNCSLDGRGLH